MNKLLAINYVYDADGLLTKPMISPSPNPRLGRLGEVVGKPSEGHQHTTSHREVCHFASSSEQGRLDEIHAAIDDRL